MSEKSEQPTKDEAELRFEESVRRFADAFFALSEEEREELSAYVEGRCEEAKQEYERRTGKK